MCVGFWTGRDPNLDLAETLVTKPGLGEVVQPFSEMSEKMRNAILCYRCKLS
jgi:hypothetical protein